MSTHANMVKMTVTGTPGTGTITLNAASSGFRTFASAYGANATVDVLITEGTAWEVARACTYTHSGTTLTRGTLESSSTGSAVTFTSAAVVSVVATAHMGNVTDLSTKGAIQGLGITYSSTTAITVAAGACAINGKLLTYAGATLTSASTMKDVANSTVTIGASKRYHVFAYDNAGTLEIRIEERDGTGDGGAPVWDSALDYYKSATTGAAARRIGAFWTNGSSQVMAMTAISEGRARKYELSNKDGLAYINYVANTGYTAMTLTPWSDTTDSQLTLTVTINNNAGLGQLFAKLSTDAGVTDYLYVAAYIPAAEYTGFGFISLKRPSTLHYATSTANTRAYLGFLGAEMFV